MSDRISVELSGENKSFASMLDHSSSLVGKFNAVLGSIGLGVSVAGVIGFGKNILDSAGKVQDLSDRLGVGVDTLQALTYHAKLAGGDITQVAGVFDKTRKSIDQMMDGQTSAAKSFDKLHLSSKDFIGLNLEQAVQVVARAYKDSAHEAGAYDAVTDIMGTKTMPKLNSVLLQYGAEGAQVFIDKTREMGVIAEEGAIPKLDAVGDKFTTVMEKAKVSGMSFMVWLDALNSSIEAGWTSVKQSPIATWFDGITTKITDMHKSVGKAVVDTPAVQWIGKVNDGIRDAVLSAVGFKKPLQEVTEEFVKSEEAVAATIPVIDKLTEREQESVKAHMAKSKEMTDQLERSERVNTLKEQEANIEKAMAQEGVTKSVQEALSISLEETRKQLKTEQKGLSAEELKHAEKMEGISDDVSTLYSATAQ